MNIYKALVDFAAQRDARGDVFLFQTLWLLSVVVTTSRGRLGELGDRDQHPTLSRKPSLGHPTLIVKSSSDYTKLELVDEGLKLLAAIDRPVAVVVVIGPYRSGKSFLLNQLLGVGCDKGFGVGHQRHAQTKGIWLWSQPQIVHGRAVFYVDTEGFESTGKAAVYDDRIFALSTL